MNHIKFSLTLFQSCFLYLDIQEQYETAHLVLLEYLLFPDTSVACAENADGTYQIQLESSRPSPEQDQERREWRTEIDAVVKCLPPAYRDLILLRHSRDLSYDEIAEITGLPLGTVKNRLFRAREMMREMFIERGFTGVS